MAAFSVQCQTWLVLTETICLQSWRCLLPGPSQKKLYLSLPKSKIRTNHIYTEAPFQAGSKWKLLSEEHKDIIYLFHSYDPQAQLGVFQRLPDFYTTDYMQKQTWEYSYLPVSQTQKRSTKTVPLFWLNIFSF